MNTRGSRVNPMVAGLIAGLVMAVIVLTMAWINVNFAAPWSSTHTLVVQTSDADGIGVSSDVRINGRLVGQVTGVEAKGQVADVTIHVDNGEWPLPASTTASVRLATLLGQKYIQLEPPAQSNGGPMLADGATIKGAKPVVDFDQILDTFDTPTRNALKDILATGGRAVANQEGTLQNLLPDLADLNQHSVVPTGELANRDASLNSILINLGVVADQLNASRDDLAGVIDNLNSINATLAQHTDTLRSFINQGDQILISTDKVLGGGYAAKLAADLPKINEIVHDLNTAFAEVVPQSQSFQQYVGPTVVNNLIYRIGDATSQSDHDGYWLRQNLQSLDLSQFGLGSPTGAQALPIAGASASASAPPKSSPLPTPPPVPPTCVLGICVGGSGSAGGGTSSGGTGSGTGGGGTPQCVVSIGNLCVGKTSDGSSATSTGTLTSDGTAGSQTTDGAPWYVGATFALWEGA
jgi:virulence factor Mce-like protein